MFARLAHIVSKHWVLVILAWVLISLAAHLTAPSWESLVEEGDLSYLPPRMTSVRAATLLKKAFPDLRSKSEVVLVLARQDDALSNADYAMADRLVMKLTPTKESEDLITGVWSYDTPILGRELVSPIGRFGQATLIILSLRTELVAIENMALIAELRKTLDALRQESDYPQGLELGMTGSAAIGADMLFAAEESIRNTEWTTIALVVLILFLVYRAPGLVIVPLLAILVSWELSTDLIALLAAFSRRFEWFDFKIFRTLKIFIVVILFGAATDYCLFLISRYLEELRRGMSPLQALEMALLRVGPAIMASAMTTILGLGMMIFAEYGKFAYGGPTIALSLLVALAACLTLVPALLRASGRAVYWPFGANARLSDEKRSRKSLLDRLWEKIGGTIVSYPERIFLASLLIMAWPAYEGLSVPITYDILSELSPNRFSLQGTNLLRQYFPTGQSGPITILVRWNAPIFNTDDGKSQISRLTKELHDFKYGDSHGVQSKPIVSVRSLTNPLGGTPGVMNPFTKLGRSNMQARGNPEIIALYLAKAPGYEGTVSRFDLIANYNPFSPEGVRLLDHIEQLLLSKANDSSSPWYQTEFVFFGATAGIRDLAAVNKSDFVRIGVLTCVVVLVVLMALLRRPMVSLFLILSVVWGYLVSIGVTKLVFTWLYGETFDGLGWRLPIFLFVILVAVGEDYNIYLMTRVVEEQEHWGEIDGLRIALICTGGIITSCGVIMAGTFASMIAGTLRDMLELGFALAFGVLLDTFVIRTIIVPSFLALWARRFRPGSLRY